MKFTYKNKKEKNDHWLNCEKNRAPCIELSNVNKEYVNIFYDVSNYNIDLELLSNDIKNMYSTYLSFFIISDQIIENLETQYYFFNFIVKAEHVCYLADKLYDYLEYKLMR
ncbi:hypothetical protein F6Q07_22890 [Pectobacterium parmentieri]|uniref:hypothetical protein n=1 Tax=Pectobacterium parmentieri TaxID=1905730 RepID=UPI000EB327B4|nr:hypothetical protein [Pectobacterium parmentieri]AYG99821.1 hypothetical protein C5E26_01945 [Pectobacterium parmentieri]AYH26059.1 hypothetical protein C5E20_02150 [Pectobacterium parmentieri]AYH30513.1 hypothetical protein C5E19_01940 [Pectobacterium parmentieri]MBI0520902.1 hypothetical protein [Pectobacterium parmentieri]